MIKLNRNRYFQPACDVKTRTTSVLPDVIQYFEPLFLKSGYIFHPTHYNCVKIIVIYKSLLLFNSEPSCLLIKTKKKSD